MTTLSPKGIPKPDLDDQPNGPVQIGALVDWIDTMLTGVTGQLLTANAATASDVAWEWPRARVVPTAAGVSSPKPGDIVFQTSAPAGLYIRTNSGTWMRVTPDLSPFAWGFIDSAGSGSGAPGTGDVALAELGPVTLAAGRRYQVTGRIRAQATTPGDWAMISGLVHRNDIGGWLSFPATPRLASPGGADPNVATVVTWGSFVGTGLSHTFNIVASRIAGSSAFYIQEGTLELSDIGAA